MKKTTGANDAMAELLSKHNEQHEIKENTARPAASERIEVLAQTEVLKQTQNTNVQSAAANMTAANHTQNRADAPNMRAPRIMHEPVIRPTAPSQDTGKIRRIMRENAQRPERGSVPPQMRVPKPHFEERVAPSPMEMDLPRPSTVKRTKRKKKIWPAVALSAGALLGVALISVAVLLAMPEDEVVDVIDMHIGAVPAAMKSKNVPVADVSCETVEAPLSTVSFNIFDGKPVSCITGDATVGELMEKMDITLAEDQILQADEADTVSEDVAIAIDKISYGTDTSVAYTDYDVKYINVQTIPKGKTSVNQKGVKGEVTTTYNVTYINGVETARESVSETVTKKPQTEIVYQGIGGTITIGGKSYNYSYYIDCKSTVYCLPGTTASGAPVSYDVIAVDPSVIPLGTKVYVSDSYVDVGFRTAADTGGAIKGNFIDIWFDPSDARYYGYGIRTARVYILE